MSWILEKTKASAATQGFLRVSLALLLILLFSRATAAQEAADAEGSTSEAAEAEEVAYLIRVPLPLVGDRDSHVIQALKKVAKEESDGRIKVALQFEAVGDESGDGSDYTRCLNLARYLTSDEASSRLRLVAYVRTSVKGHAVLPVISCQQIVMNREAELGAAGLGETFIEAHMKQAYIEFAQRRGVVPVAMAVGMLDASEGVYQIDGADLVLKEEADKRRGAGDVGEIKTIVEPGTFGVFTGAQLRLQFGVVSHFASNRGQLANALGLSPNQLQEDASLDLSWRGLLVEFRGPIQPNEIEGKHRSIQDTLRDDEVNLIVVHIDSTGGGPEASARLGNYLASLDGSKIRTVAFVQSATSDAALIALGCSEVFMTADAKIGGTNEAHIDRDSLGVVKSLLQEMAEAKGKNWSLPMSLVDSSLAVYRYSRAATGEERYLSNEEFRTVIEIPENWEKGELIETVQGLSTSDSIATGLASAEAIDRDEVLAEYGLESSDLEKAESSWLIYSLEQLGRQPWFARTLLFVAFFALMSEASAPGLGAAGFISGLAFLLFFWTQFLNGTANWLEVLLFFGGIVAIGIEFVVLPGLGIFGIGGGIMLLTSLVLASQTFVVPNSVSEVNQLSSSLITILIAMGGIVVGLATMRHMIHKAPIVSKLVLETPDAAIEQREGMVHLDGLSGKRGTAITRLSPAGKARFGDDLIDVVSDGEMIDRGSDIYVAEILGNRVVVKAMEA